MDITVPRADSLKIKVLPEGETPMERERLRVLLGLAIAIGRCEGLLGNNLGIESNVKRSGERMKVGSRGDKRNL